MQAALTELQQQLQQEQQQRRQLEQQVVGCVLRGPMQDAAVQASVATVHCSLQTRLPEEDERPDSHCHAGNGDTCGFRCTPAGLLTPYRHMRCVDTWQASWSGAWEQSRSGQCRWMFAACMCTAYCTNLPGQPVQKCCLHSIAEIQHSSVSALQCQSQSKDS